MPCGTCNAFQMMGWLEGPINRFLYHQSEYFFDKFEGDANAYVCALAKARNTYPKLSSNE